jgi:hypothetical protein
VVDRLAGLHPDGVEFKKGAAIFVADATQTQDHTIVQLVLEDALDFAVVCWPGL